MSVTPRGRATERATLYDRASRNHQALTVTMRLVQKCHLSLPVSVSVTLQLSLSLSLSLIHTSTHTQTHTHEHRKQNVFISPLYAGRAQPEIAALTPRCELYRGNVYPNPTEHAINLFLDGRQTRMSLHEGNKDRNTYPGPSRQSSHYEAAGGGNEPGSPVSQGLFLGSVPMCLTFSEVPTKCSEVQTTD